MKNKKKTNLFEVSVTTDQRNPEHVQFYLTNRVRVIDQISHVSTTKKRCFLWFLVALLIGFVLIILLSSNGII